MKKKGTGISKDQACLVPDQTMIIHLKSWLIQDQAIVRIHLKRDRMFLLTPIQTLKMLMKSQGMQ
jgi:hypothetical protein